MNTGQKIADILVESGAATLEDKELCSYGLRQSGIMLLNVATTLVIGLALGMVWQSIVFSLAYIPLRIYAGGYHAKTQLRCYLLSIAMMAAVLLGIRLVPWNGLVCAIAALCAGLIIFLLAPVEDRNKPLDQEEQRVYKKRARVILSVLFVTALFTWLIGQPQIVSCIVAALTTLSVMLVLGKIKNIF